MNSEATNASARSGGVSAGMKIDRAKLVTKLTEANAKLNDARIAAWLANEAAPIFDAEEAVLVKLIEQVKVLLSKSATAPTPVSEAQPAADRAPAAHSANPEPIPEQPEALELAKGTGQSQHAFCSGIGQYHSNEPGAEHPKPYLTTTFAEIQGMVDKPPSVDKRKGLWFIPSTLASRNFGRQEREGRFGVFAFDLDTNPIPLAEVAGVVRQELPGINFEVYASRSATEAKQKGRILIRSADLLDHRTTRIAQEIIGEKLAEHGITIDPALMRAGQLVYLPNKGGFYSSFSKRDGSPLDAAALWGDEIERRKAAEDAEAAELRATTKARAKARAERLAAAGGDASTLGPIERYNLSTDVTTLLLKHGYEEDPQKPGNWRHPASASGNYSLQITEAGGVYGLSTEDPLGAAKNGGHALSPFDVLTILECGGDDAKAREIVGCRVRVSAADDFAAEPRTVRAPPPEELVPPHLPPPYPGAHAALVQAVSKSMYIVQADLANLAVLVAMASAIHGGYRYADGLRPNLYAAVIADTAEGKEAPVNSAQSIASRCGARTCSTPASGEALEDQLVSGQGLLVLFREAGHIFGVMAGRNAAPHHVSLARNLLDFFSASGRRHEKRVRAAARGQRGVEVEVIDYPMTNLLMASTPDKLGEALTSDNIKDGLLGRILFAFGRKDAPRNPDCEDFDGITLDFTKPAVEFQASLIRWSREADAARHPIESNNIARKRELQAQGDSIEAALIGRSFDKAKRIAGVLAVWDNPIDPIVTLPMLEWAIAFVNASDDGLRVFIRRFMHDSAVHADSQKIIAAMRRVHAGGVKPMTPSQFALIAAGHLPRTMVLKSSGLEPKRFDEAMKLLEGTEQAKQYRVDYKQGFRDENALAIAFC